MSRDEPSTRSSVITLSDSGNWAEVDDTRPEFLSEMVALEQSGRLNPHRVVIAALKIGREALDPDFVGSFMLGWSRGPIVEDLESHIVYLRDGVGGAVLANRIDDLIVRVSWNMYRTRGPVR